MNTSTRTNCLDLIIIFNCSFTLIYRYELPDNHELLDWVSYSSLSLLWDVINCVGLLKLDF